MDERNIGAADGFPLPVFPIIPFFQYSIIPVFFGPVAQLVEQLTLNQLAESSSLSRPTSNIKELAR
jgi:hypothetical protein